MAESDFAERLGAHQVVRMHGLGDVAREHRRSRRDCIAVLQHEHRISYAEFDARVNRLVGYMWASGLGSRSRVLWFAQNSQHLLETIVGCAKLGAIVCIANWRLTPVEMAHVLADFDPQLVLWQDAELGDIVQTCRAADAGDRVWLQQDGDGAECYEAVVGQFPDLDDDARVSPEEPLLAIYSSAFDGKPRAVLQTQSAVMFQGLSTARVQDIWSSSVMLNSGPLFHLGNLNGMIATFMMGGANVFMRRMDAETALQLIERHRVTHAFLPGPTLGQIRTINESGKYDISSIFSRPDASDWTSPSAMCTPAHAPIAQRPGGYGQTEVMGHVSMRAYGGEGGCGRPNPMVQVMLVDGEGDEVADGEVGEILVRGPFVMAGYHGEAPNARHLKGWHRTYDLGRRLPDGSLTFVGPAQTMIKTGKENVYPVEVENCIRLHPAVADVCVIGVPDPVWQQNIKAVVVLKAEVGETDPETIIAHCRERLASYKKPKIVHYVAQLPRSGGVVDRAAVDAEHGGGGYPAR